MPAWIPKQGDLVDLDFDPQAGHEQKGRRPALVVSKEAFNKGTGMAICCPITNTDRRMPFHVPIAGRTSLTAAWTATLIVSTTKCLVAVLRR
jgi:mRNA interferase MazF